MITPFGFALRIIGLGMLASMCAIAGLLLCIILYKVVCYFLCKDRPPKASEPENKCVMIAHYDFDGDIYYTCSCCGASTKQVNKFCFNCMRTVDEVDYSMKS